MKYRKFGKLPVEVSALGFGTMRLPVLNDENFGENINEEEAIRMIRYAIDNGVNYVDTAWMYHNGNSEKLVGKALQDGYRERTYLATKYPQFTLDGNHFNEILDEQLNRLQTDHIDFYLIHNMNNSRFEKMKEWGVMDDVKKAREEGKITYIGFSCHDSYENFVKNVDGFDWDFCQIQLNYADINRQAGLKGLQYAGSKGLGVVIMEPMMGGKLANLSDELKERIGKPLPQFNLNFLWHQPEVAVVLSGMSEMQHVVDNIQYASQSSVGMLNEADLALYADAKKWYLDSIKVGCTKCQYCMPCPNGLNIPEIYDIYNRYCENETKEIEQEYYALEYRAVDCIECGYCASQCPQSIQTPELMKKVARKFHDRKQ